METKSEIVRAIQELPDDATASALKMTCFGQIRWTLQAANDLKDIYVFIARI